MIETVFKLWLEQVLCCANNLLLSCACPDALLLQRMSSAGATSSVKKLLMRQMFSLEQHFKEMCSDNDILIELYAYVPCLEIGVCVCTTESRSVCFCFFMFGVCLAVPSYF